VAVNRDGTLSAWGLMDDDFELIGGQAPIQVGMDTDRIAAVADPANHVRNCAVKTDGSVWTVGFGSDHGFSPKGVGAQPTG
jgi:hypothetical protein